jgi:ATP-binding cassette subfamily B (MDR/TAP) protein 1
MSTFQLPAEQMVHRSNFLSLMFFVVALAIFIVYFVLGWVSNGVSQVPLVISS